MKVVVAAAALADLERLRAFLSDKNPAAAKRATAALLTAVESLHQFPERGRSIGAGNVRELIIAFGRSGYVLRYVYSATAGEIVILRLWHGREMRE
jgi:plasmid stabilization system protein ParE